MKLQFARLIASSWRWVLAVVVIVSATFLGLAWPRVADAAFYASHPSVEESVEHFMQTQGVPGASVAVGRSGEAPRLYAFGYADPVRHIAMRTDNRLRIASVSKLVTAAAVLQLVDDGEITLDTRLADLFPEVRGAADPRFQHITIRHLLQHSSGMGGLPGAWSKTTIIEPAKGCRRFADALLRERLHYEPGTKSLYSDAGPCWLGLVVERVSGQPYESFVQARVLRPLGISTLGIQASDVVQQTPAQAKTRVLPSSVAGFSGTAADVFRLVSRPIRPQETRGIEGAGKPYYFGLGWWVWPVSSGVDISHTGLTDGSVAVVIRGHDGIVAVALFNGQQRVRNRESLWHLQRALLAAYRSRPS